MAIPLQVNRRFALHRSRFLRTMIMVMPVVMVMVTAMIVLMTRAGVSVHSRDTGFIPFVHCKSP
ncbi:hypothetical protein [Sinorhizobium sp. BG8]|uniref:hypothetical protein n=1 Tax=Sinorhizobium sp. BG8 TaxID=2613773 RepID=UPI001FEE6D25|nr:hypothetical protein [Sinorhizobium sp. BG8]